MRHPVMIIKSIKKYLEAVQTVIGFQIIVWGAVCVEKRKHGFGGSLFGVTRTFDPIYLLQV